MCSTNLFIFFLATNEHKFSLNSIRIVFTPHGISAHWCNSWLKKIIVSGFQKNCLWTTSILLPFAKTMHAYCGRNVLRPYNAHDSSSLYFAQIPK